MSRFVTVCLCAVLAFVSVTGVSLLLPNAARAASGAVTMETPLHVEPDPSTPLVALLSEGTEVTIDGPPVGGFYPVTANGLTGWMRGETLSLTKDITEEVVEGESTPIPDSTGDVPIEEVPIEEVPIEQEATDTALTTEPVSTADPPVDAPAANSATGAPTEGEWVEPAPAALIATAVPTTTTDPAMTSPTDVAAPAADPNLEPTTDTAMETLVQPSPTATPVATDTAVTQPSPVAAPAPTPTPTPVAVPVGPAGVLVDMPVYYGPDSGSGLVFTVPAGSTVERTGELANGFASVRYKEVVGWSAADQMAEASDFASETPEEAAVPADTREPKPGSGVAFATVDMSLRSEPTANSEPITVVPAGSRLVLTGVMEGEFQRVTYGDLVGWISNDYLNNPESPAPNGQGGGGQDNYSRKQIVRYITQAANEFNQSPEDMLRVAQCESNLDPYAVNPSGSYGLFQFIRSTWKSTPYGKQDIFDPQANAQAAAWMWSEGRKSEWVCQ